MENEKKSTAEKIKKNFEKFLNFVEKIKKNMKFLFREIKF